MTHPRVSSSLIALTSRSPDRHPIRNRDPWDSKAEHLRTQVAKLREEVERLIEAEELRVFIYRLRHNRASRHLHPHKPPRAAGREARVAPAADRSVNRGRPRLAPSHTGPAEGGLWGLSADGLPTGQ